ncbi:MAG: ribonuclease III [Deltaproteobacteria bacterium]|nr:ribonuclease III [Deltaproteobacteria bacterium]NCP03807.1 ribonuclease III [Deltaproteobacteria bacterium]
MNEFSFARLQEQLGYTFRSSSLLLQALTHKSYSNEQREALDPHNERLEFLGDAVLELAVSHYVYRHFPQVPEGGLTRIRAEVVCEKGLARLARRLQLGAGLRLGRGEEKCGGRKKASLLSDAVEALMGAIFLEGGFPVACAVVEHLCAADIQASGKSRLGSDHKTALQEKLQAIFGELPVYQLLGIEGPDHNRSFVVQVAFHDEILGCGQGSSKKQAEQQAAAAALSHAFVRKLESPKYYE